MKISLILEELESTWCVFTPDDIGVLVATGATRGEGLPAPDVTEPKIRETVAA